MGANHHHRGADATPGNGVGTVVADGVIELDTMLGGWDRVTAGYLVEGDSPVLVETGSQSSVPVLLDQLEQLGVDADGLAAVVVTHIHLDHAGGVGDVARAFPKATVYVHPKGARHLADPTKLVDSAARVYGPLLDSLYGRLDPTPEERIRVLEDGETIRVGPNRALVAVDSPGHAKHHMALHDTLSGILFAGDAVGVKLPDAGVLRPSTPPPDFDLSAAIGHCDVLPSESPPGWPWPTTASSTIPWPFWTKPTGTLRRVGRRGRVGFSRRPGHRRRPGHGIRVRSRRGPRRAPPTSWR